MAAPGPGFAGRNEADFRHEMTNRRLVEAKAGRQWAVDRIFAAMLPNMVGVGCQAIGKVDAEPMLAQPAERQIGSTRVGTSVESCR